MVDFEELAKIFKKYFVKKYGYQPESERFAHGSGWIYAWVPGQGNWYIHYELILRGGNAFVELHVESKISTELKTRFANAFSKKTRRYSYSTYYSNQYWATRNPVTTPDEVTTDLEELCKIVNPVFEEVSNGNAPEDGESKTGVSDSEYEEMSLADVAGRLRATNCEKRLAIPGVQRGRVWNAARIAALWDSLLRGFPVGAFSVRRVDPNGDGGSQQTYFELLDGQQRANAIALGFREFPPVPDSVDKEESKQLSNDESMASRIAYETPILWIDLDGEEAIRGTEKKYAFFVTTASQPWGYDVSEDETHNVLLSTSERRLATYEVSYQNENDNEFGKPYACELYPIKAKLPVPFTLLREYIWENHGSEPIKVSKFCEWAEKSEWAKTSCSEKGVKCANWINKIKNTQKEVTSDLVSAIRKMREYKIFCTDATNVEDRDIALYFTRIGKGGVRPSDEELAFSVLKSKLGDDFRKTVYTLAQTGMASPARIAHIAVRCFASASAHDEGNRFFSGNVLSEAMAIAADAERMKQFHSFVVPCKDESKDESKVSFSEMIDYVNTGVLGINVEEDAGFSEWHLSRFCSESNGDVYLFLLLEVRDFARDATQWKWSKYNEEDANAQLLRGAAAIVSQGACMVERCLRYIRNQNEQDYATRLKLGLSESFRDSYRNKPILLVPPHKSEYDDVNNLADFLRGKGRAAEMLKSGYGNQRAYFMLLFACKKALPQFSPYATRWEEENCPWDYDHILPRSWVEDLDGKADLCKELVNSIGNLAPLPYSVNRKLSDKNRLKTYPCSEETEKADVKQKQKALHICANEVGTINKDAFRSSGSTEERENFCKNVFERFKRIYIAWYDGLGLEKLLNYGVNAMNPGAPIISRAKLLTEVLTELQEQGGGSYKPYGFRDGREEPFCDALGYYSYQWVSIERDCGNFSISFTVDDTGVAKELGLRKSPSQISCDDTTRENLKKVLNGNLPEGAAFEEKNDFWYVYSKALENMQFLDPKTVVEKIRDFEQLCVDNKLIEPKNHT